MKILKTVILSSILLTSGVSSLNADFFDYKDTFVALTWSPSTADGKIENVPFDGAGMIGFVLGDKKLISDNIGAYFSGDFSYNKVDETDTSYKVTYNYKIVNFGITFSMFDKLTLMGGIGYSSENAEFSSGGVYYNSDVTNTQTNYNFGASYNVLDNFGVVVTYNTAPSSIGYGLSFSF
jgi:hypothetical protein